MALMALASLLTAIGFVSGYCVHALLFASAKREFARSAGNGKSAQQVRGEKRNRSKRHGKEQN